MLLLVTVVVAADYALVGPWHPAAPWQRLLIWLAIAFGIEALLCR